MTPPDQQPDPARWDTGNRLLSPSPIEFTLTLGTGADGVTMLIATARTTSGTLTGQLDRDGALALAAALNRKIAKMPALIVPPGRNGGPR